MALTPEEIRRMQMRAQAFKMGQQAVSGRSPLGPQDVYNLPGQQREQGYYYDQPNIPGQPGAVRPVTQQQHWAKRLGMGALRGLDVMAAGGGGTLRRLGQAITPGEQILEKELGRITQERGATMNPWEKFKRYGEASRLDPGEEWTTPFGWAEHKGFRYLPEKIGTRGIAEVAGDPINLAALVPFVGAPIRAAEMGLLGLAKGAIAGSAGSVGRGLAVGGGKRTLGEAAKGIARAPGRGLARAGEEAVKGVKGSIDIERKIGRGIFTPTRAAPKGDKAKIVGEAGEEIVESTRHAEQEMMKARVPSKLIDDATDDSLEVKDIAYKFTAPMERFANTRVGEFVLGTNMPGFKETFGRSKLGVAFAERIGGLKMVANLEGNHFMAKTARLLNRHNKDASEGTQKQNFLHAAVNNLQREMGPDGFDFDSDGFIKNVLYDADGKNIKNFDTLTDLQKRNTHSLKIFEEVSKEYNYKTKRIEGKGAVDKNGVLNEFSVTTFMDGEKVQIKLNNRQVRIAEGLLDNLNEMGKHAYSKEISAQRYIDEDGLLGEKGKNILLRETDADEALKKIAQAQGVKFIGGHNKGGYIAHIWKLGGNAKKGGVEDYADWEDLFALNMNRKRAGISEAAEKARLNSTDELVEMIMDGTVANAGKQLLFTPADILSNYGKMAIKKNARDNLELGLANLCKAKARKVRTPTQEVWLKAEADRLGKTITDISDDEAADIIKKEIAYYKTEFPDETITPNHGRDMGEQVFYNDEFMRAVADARNPKLGGKENLTNLEATAVAFKQVAPEIGKRLSRHMEIRAKGGIAGFSKWVNGEIFGPLRGLRAGIDLGFMGINTLPLLFTRPQAYAQTWKRALHVLRTSPDNYEAFVAKNMEKFMDMTDMGITLGGQSTDIYDALRGPSGSLGILGRTPVIGKYADKAVSFVQRPLERSFYASLDSARLSLYDFYSPLWEGLEGQARLAMRNSMSDFINYSTGGFNSIQQGLTPTQRDIESGWIFFSPRYTRASMALVAKAFSGDVAGIETRRILNNALTVAIPTYIHTANALGQEPNLDPTSGNFLSIKIDGDYIGPATFFRQLATLTARLIEDPEAIAFMDDRPGITYKDKIFNHPIVKFFRGRTPLGTGLAVDLATGADFMGRELEGTADWTKHTGKMALPFWAENAAFGDPYRAGPAGIVSEMLGARSFPESPYNKRTELRDRLAAEKFNSEWNLLANNEKKFLETETPELVALDEMVREMRKGRDQGFDRLMEGKKTETDALDEEWEDMIMPIYKHIIDGGSRWTLPDLIETSQMATRVRRQKRHEIETSGKYDEIQEYYDELHKEGRLVKQFADTLNEKYMHEVIESTVYPDGAVNYAARERASNLFFSQFPEMESYIDTGNYLRGLLKGQPPLIAEYYEDSRHFRYYWESSENVVLDEMPQYQMILPMYEEWKEATYRERDILEENNIMLQNFLGSLKRTRLYMRKQDKLLDRFLVRWGVGGVQTPQHPENKILHDEDIAKGETRFRLHDYNIRTQDV